MVVVSATGKTTNTLEVLGKSYMNGHKEGLSQNFESVKQCHPGIMNADPNKFEVSQKRI